MPSIDLETSVGQLVVERPSRSRVFATLGIDFCCGGKRSLAKACQSKGLDPESVAHMLLAAESTADAEMPDVAHMALGDLCDHIESSHHAMLKTELPRLQQMLERVGVVHGDRYPYMRETLAVFGPFQQELTGHIFKEEQVLFPRALAAEADLQVGAMA